MSKVLGRSLSFAAVSLVFASAIGCGVEADESGTETETASGALVAGQSFVVSFTGGGIPANASSLVTSAGGTIVARYNAVGAVLARSASGSFAATLRATPGIDAVGNAAAVHSSISPVIMKTVKRPPHKHPPSAGGDPLSFRQWDMDQIHAPQARAITNGKPSVLVGLFDSGIDITHPDLAGRVKASASASLRGRHRQPAQATWSSDPIGHGTLTSGVVGAAKNNVGIVGVAPGVTPGDGQGRRRRLQRSERRPGVRRRVRLRRRLGDRTRLGSDQRQPHDRSVHRAGSTTPSAATSRTGPRSSRSSAARSSRRRATRSRWWRRPETRSRTWRTWTRSSAAPTASRCRCSCRASSA